MNKMNNKKLEELMEKYNLLPSELDDVFNFVSDLLHLKAKHIEATEPYAHKTIAELEKASYEAWDLSNYINELEEDEMNNPSPSITYPLYGIIYNWKGLKEENYLYTAEELKKFDPELYEECEDYPYSWHDSTLADCPWKTWMGIRIKNEIELSQFLEGCYNEKPDEDDEGWYWEDMEDNDLYGYPSNTMREVLAELKGGAK